MSGFSYRILSHNNKIMVIIPHEDDEINVAGTVITGARQEGLQVICIFVTNGDWECPAEVRYKEALQSLQVLGVPREDIIFLGYPDGGIHAERSVWVHGVDQAVSVLGHTKTSGIYGIPEYSMQSQGRHSSYTKKCFLTDLESVILKYQAGCIICVDFDFHPDHRMCSLGFENVMGRILRRERNAYKPLVLKGFAYSTAFESVPDFYGINLQSSIVNQSIVWNQSYDTDQPSYEWEKRVRLPVPANCRSRYLHQNKIFKALSSHVSQKAIGRADRIINGDQVFWERRTDNLLHQGQLTVSSGCAEYLSDFILMDVRDIAPRVPEVHKCAWIPGKNDPQKFCKCTFKKPEHIEKVVLYGNIEQDSRIMRGKLIFSTGYWCAVGEFKPHGQAMNISVPPQDDVEWVEFRVLETEGDHAGIAEWEIFSTLRSPLQLIHITVNGQFAYDWNAASASDIKNIDLYMYGIENKVRWFVDGKSRSLEEIHNMKSRACIIRAEVENHPELSNEICWRPYTVMNRLQDCMKYLWDRFMVRLEIYREKPIHHKIKNQIRERAMMSKK